MATLLGTTFGGNYITNEQGRQDHVANTLPSPYYRFDGNDYIYATSNQTTYPCAYEVRFRTGTDVTSAQTVAGLIYIQASDRYLNIFISGGNLYTERI